MYAIIEIATPAGYVPEALDVNKWGTVVGVLRNSAPGGADVAFKWGQFGGLQLLPARGGSAEARAINNSGMVAGAVVDSGLRAAVWDSQLQLQILPGPAQAVTTFSHDIGESGTVVGGFIQPGPSEHPARWFNLGQAVQVPVGFDGIWDEALAINLYGVTIGSAGVRGFVWPYGAATPSPLYPPGIPRAIADNGDIAGEWNGQPAIWTGGIVQPLPLIPGFPSGAATSINIHGCVVGDCNDQISNSSRAFLYRPWKGATESLNSLVDPSLGWDLQKATAINEADEIVGFGMHQGRPHAYFMTPRSTTGSLGQAVIAMVTQILAGGRLDNRGVGLGPQGPIPIPPWASELLLGRRSNPLNDLWTQLSITELAGLVSEPNVRLASQRQALVAIRSEVERLLGSMPERMHNG